MVESAAHHRSRNQRAADRRLHNAVNADNRLTTHHGSTTPKFRLGQAPYTQPQSRSPSFYVASPGLRASPNASQGRSPKFLYASDKAKAIPILVMNPPNTTTTAKPTTLHLHYHGRNTWFNLDMPCMRLRPCRSQHCLGQRLQLRRTTSSPRLQVTQRRNTHHHQRHAHQKNNDKL